MEPTTAAAAASSAIEDATATVRFNVGGAIYEVSQSLLDRHPDTKLANLASSDTWQSVGNDDDDDDGAGAEDDVKFIERDGERFRYCLDYMRDDGTVELPATVSKQAFLRDLNYLGFKDVDVLKITVVGSTRLLQTSLDSIKSIIETWESTAELCILKYQISLLAKHCLCYYATMGTLEEIPLEYEFPSDATLRPHYVYNEEDDMVASMKLVNNSDFGSPLARQVFNEYLKLAGLKWKSGHGSGATVALELLE